MRSCARERLLLQLLPQNSAVRAVADELLGVENVGFTTPGYYSAEFSTDEAFTDEDFSEAKTRGIYAVMPYAHNRPRTRLQLHNDSTLESRDRVSCVADDASALERLFLTGPFSACVRCYLLFRELLHAYVAKQRIAHFAPFVRPADGASRRLRKHPGRQRRPKKLRQAVLSCFLNGAP